MKTRFTQKFLMAFLMIGLFTTSQAQTYVNGAASGANDGSSWADAYTDLSAAIGAATSGDLWVAAGTYVPADAGLDSFNTFLIMNPVNIYGGFAGTEASIDDRVDGNATILSGDVAGDDMDNVFTANKEDNLSHVMTIDVGATDVVILDGLTISGGSAATDNAADNNYVWAGAGIYAVSTVEVSDCHFLNNSSASGAGMYLLNDAGGSKIDNCLFEKSLVLNQGAGAMANTIDGFTVTNSEFKDNITARGALYPLRTTDLMVDNCTFTNNVNSAGTGGAMFIWNSVGTLQNCTFTGNNAASAGCFYYDGRELDAGVVGLVIENNTFTGNSTAGRGGAINTFSSKLEITNCTFEDNEAIDIGGAILFASCDYLMTGCTFTGNSASGNGGAIFEFGLTGTQVNTTFKNNFGSDGGAISLQGGEFSYTGNTFDSNTSTSNGGAIFSGFGTITSFTNCLFEDNSSDSGPSGAIWAQNDTTVITIERSQFIGNTSGGGSGAIGRVGPIPLTISNSLFSGNSAVGFGGAINGSEALPDEPGESKVTMTNSIFRENFSDAQGAGFSFIDYDVDITNCEFAANIGEGTGGAMSFNATDTSNVSVNITHSTIVNNFAVIGAGIASFTGETDSKLSITLTNTILANPDGLNYEVEDGTAKFSSNGGNISSDASTAGAFTNTNDMNEIDADDLFIDIDDFDYRLTGTSLAKDNGVDAGVAEDINGNARVDAPDSGAYESVDPDTSTEEVLENNGQLMMTPNPAATISTITVDNAWNGVVNMIVTDMSGKVVANQNINKSAQTQDFNLNVSELSGGNYILTLRAEDAVVSTQFIKI